MRIALLLLPLTLNAQVDLTLDVDWEGTWTVGCNYGHTDNLVFGLHAEGLDTAWAPCLSSGFHVGWTFTMFPACLSQGQEQTFSLSQVANPCWEEIWAYKDSLCLELVIWQIDLSQTLHTWDSEWGWTNGPSAGNETAPYPDVSPWNNQVSTCPQCYSVTDYEVLLDTIVETNILIYFETVYETLTDTIYVPVVDTIHVTQTDTVVVENTIIETVFDTLLVETSIIDTTYLLHFETLDHYLIQCEELFCDIYIPTAFTPDGDGLNDTWKPRTEEECWGTWEVRVYNAWGQLVFFSYDIHEAWHGAASGIYTYSIYAHGFEQVTLSGHILCLK